MLPPKLPPKALLLPPPALPPIELGSGFETIPIVTPAFGFISGSFRSRLIPGRLNTELVIGLSFEITVGNPVSASDLSKELKDWLLGAPIKASEIMKKGLRKICAVSEDAAAGAPAKTIASIIEGYKLDNNETLMHKAAFYGACSVVESLAANGVSVDTQNKLGYTPLMLACIKQHWDVAKVLVSHSQQVDLLDNNGCNALHHLLKHNIEGDSAQLSLMNLIIEKASEKHPGTGFMLLQQQGIVEGAAKDPCKIIREKKSACFNKGLVKSLEQHKAAALEFIVHVRALAAAKAADDAEIPVPAGDNGDLAVDALGGEGLEF